MPEGRWILAPTAVAEAAEPGAAETGAARSDGRCGIPAGTAAAAAAAAAAAGPDHQRLVVCHGGTNP